ncbi:ABC transporter permease [Chamaesiphon sp. VAR_48_metabat_135_sub]|uniref:ABC transporter permease n=1 Tax=Chamaesiphon sp. VAR_48_metabat_135_sub TaxID=2964699 RepID=UPI00286B08AA|nr:ABC transporter permease [Chamaesiphon sp. VAR_48_metabat_135_sub]
MKTKQLPKSLLRPSRRSKRKISLLEIFLMAVETLWSNKIRSGLTMLGVIIGISSVIAITSIGQGVQKSTELQIQALGTNILQVSAASARTGGISQGAGSASTLTWEDAQAIAKQVPAATAVAAYLQRQNIQVVRGNINIATNALGADLNLPVVRNLQTQLGAFFRQEDLDIAKPVVVLGSKVWNDLFSPSENPIGADIRVRGNRYTVIGVMESKGSIGGQDADDIIYIPLTNMSAEIVGNNSLTGTAINGFLLQSSDADQLEAAQFQVTNVLRLRHNIRPPKEDDFRVTNQVDIINTFTSIAGSLTLMVGAIAGISLIVGGIGIANIMLVSVMERTREIGLRKAVGATSGAILNQFLMESIVISSIGGAIGIGLGIAIAFAAATVFKFPFVVSLWSVVLGFVISLIVGVLAGGIPARNAAKLDPILALHGD